MSSQSADGFLVALASGDTLVEATDVTARPAAAIEADGIGRFDEGGELVGGGEPRNAAHLERDDDGEHEPYAGKGEEQLNGGGLA